MPKIFPPIKAITLDETESGELIRFKFRGDNSLAIIARQEGQDGTWIVLLEATEVEVPCYFLLKSRGMRAMSFGKDYRIILSMDPANTHLGRAERHGVFIGSDRVFLFVQAAPGELVDAAWIDIDSGTLTYHLDGEMACISSWKIVIDDLIGNETIEIFQYQGRR